ncbi:formate dehydrogenase subunit alpha [Ferrimonas marina]|uniref:Formate dehydrogenase major subunit n=1 Tax=Ferrimonas marina TaxID=299255 RepID=A0A1M5YV56_9GAMM|nr:formate dehydrogenase subunit alpha [Ferrimonas marina]SHI15433.1 formate dehydrogenase major subunit [Ferrimonas marina]
MSKLELTLDGNKLTAETGETLLSVARRAGATVPTLCHRDGHAPQGNCRACMVEVEGERTLAPACCREVKPGMVVYTQSRRARQAQQGVLSMLLSDTPDGAAQAESELRHWAERMQVQIQAPMGQGSDATRLGQDASHPAFALNWDACIQCNRCVQACRDEQVNDVLGWAHRGGETRLIFDNDSEAGSSRCVACGECVQACPTSALALVTPEPATALTEERTVDSLCPFCGVGCAVRYRVRDDRIIAVEGADGPANRGRLCVKGRFGFDYVHHPQRLTQPLIRRADAPKDPSLSGDWREQFRPASWEEALALASGGLKTILEQQGPQALAGLGSAKGSNEEAYLFQKLVRTGFGSNNVDHCTRLCHASSVAALMEAVGSAAVSNPVADVAYSDVILLMGANPEANHPVAASWMKNAVKAGTELLLLDPQALPLARHARHHLQFVPGSDILLLNAMIHVLFEQDLVNWSFVEARLKREEVEALRQAVQAYAPEAVAEQCGVTAAQIRQVTHVYASANRAMMFWAMGVTQHTHGTDNVRCLIALCLLTGQIGRPGTGLHPLRGQNNVQGASDAGLIPHCLPDYQKVAEPEVRARFAQAWGAPVPDSPGLTTVEMMQAAHQGSLQGMYIVGENPAMSDPDLTHTRAGLARLSHLVVQDLFLTETAALADVVLPAAAFAEKGGSFTNTDRRVQLGRPVIPAPGEAKQDWWLIQQMAQGLGLAWDYQGPEQIYREMQALMPSLAGIPYERLQAESSVVYPADDPAQPGQSVLFAKGFARPGGRARLVPATPPQQQENADKDYPFTLITGRLLEHWHTGTMTRRSQVLSALAPQAQILVHPETLTRLGLHAGQSARLRSRRGSVVAQLLSSSQVRPDDLFLPFSFREAAANLLTRDALDPVAKIAALKLCAVALEPVA